MSVLILNKVKTAKVLILEKNLLRYLRNIYVNCVIQWQTKFIKSLLHYYFYMDFSGVNDQYGSVFIYSNNVELYKLTKQMKYTMRELTFQRCDIVANKLLYIQVRFYAEV